MSKLQAVSMRHRAPDEGFPIGWYGVAASADVTGDDLLPIYWLDRQFVVYRTGQGHAQVADAYCPHLGAHLASHEGKACQGRITCPFHKWEFDGATGEVSHIPYTDVMVPRSVRLTLYPTREIGDTVLMWFHPRGEEPAWEPFDSNVLRGDDNWVHYLTKTWETTCPFRDILENLFDTAHIVQLHCAAEPPAMKAFDRTPYGLRVAYDTEAGMADEAARLRQFECHFDGVTLLTQYYVGVGWKALFVFTFTPIDRERFVQTTRLYLQDPGDPATLEALGKSFAERFVFEVDQDMQILNFKKHLPQPRLCAGDGPIMKFRRYAEAFYG